jgi:hypothetical protein
LKIYLDTSVINVYLFGRYSDIEADRFPVVNGLFELINSKKLRAIVSLYSIQEIYSFCKKTSLTSPMLYLPFSTNAMP